MNRLTTRKSYKTAQRPKPKPKTAQRDRKPKIIKSTGEARQRCIVNSALDLTLDSLMRIVEQPSAILVTIAHRCLTGTTSDDLYDLLFAKLMKTVQQSLRPQQLYPHCSRILIQRSIHACCSIFSRVHATLHPALSVRPSVCRSVGPSHFYFFLIHFIALSHFKSFKSKLSHS